MRTNIDLDDELLQQAMRFSKARSKSALVHEALRTYVDAKMSEQRRFSYRERLDAIRNRTSSLRLGKSTTEIVRSDRNRA